MKCDELEEWYAGQFSPSARVYGALDVTEAIAELKEFAEDACLERDDNQTAIDELQAENAEIKANLDKVIAERDGNQVCIDALKQKLENVQASMYADVVDANMENRKLKRALYKACAEWALSTIAWLDCIDQGNPVKWGEMRRRCLEKVEEYK